jgi:hypothetical protein
MASHFAKLTDAKKEFKARTGIDYKDQHKSLTPIGIYFRNKNRKKNGLKPLAKPYFVGSYIEWVNL